MIKKVFLMSGWIVLLALLWVLPIAAQRQSATVTPAPAAPLDVTPAEIGFTLKSGETAWLDNSSACANPPDGPRAMWIAIGITNLSSEPLTNTVATLSGFTSADYTLTADPMRYIGILLPGETFDAFWYVSYTCERNRVGNYTVTISATNLTEEAHSSYTLTTVRANAVGSGAIVSATKGSGIAVGQIYTQTVQYSFGNDNKATVLLQPTGDIGFSDTCFRLVAAEVTYSTVEDIPQGTTNRLYFPASEPTLDLDPGDRVDMLYFWQAMCRSESTSTPWTVVTDKYSKDYGVYFSTFPTASLSLSLTVAVTPTLLTSAGTVTYTIRLRNSFSDPVFARGIRLHLPHGLTYKAMAASSQVRNDNSSQYPSAGAAGMLTWKGIPLSSYTVPASGTITPGEPGTLDLIFTADVPAISGRYTSITTLTVGIMDVGPLNVTFDVDLPTAVTLASFEATPQNAPQGGAAILVTWETAMELDHVGFNLYRSTAAAGPYTQRNTTLIPPQFPGEVMGGSYEWRDTDVQPGVTYYYKLEDIDIKGVRTVHGPISTVSVTAPTAVKLRQVSARSAVMPLALGLMLVLGLVVVYRQRRLP